jgi:hypothetical protein
MTKRQKFLMSAGLLSVGLLMIQYIPLDYRYVAIFGFFLVTYLVSAWALFDDLKAVEWLTILSLPSLYAVAIGLFYFLLPGNWISRLVIVTLFGVGMYALYLTENIYSVAAVRTIQLLRAAHAVGFLLSILTIVLLYNTIFSLQWPFWANGLLVFIASFPVVLQGLWSIQLDKKVSPAIWRMSGGLSLAYANTAIVLSFLPVTVWIAALFLGSMVYVSLGLLQHELSERLFSRTITEYVVVGILVLLATMMVTPWK